MKYSPWGDLARHAELELVWRRLVGVDSLYDRDGRTVFIDPRLLQAERRCALAHELVHAERGDAGLACPVLDLRQEILVESMSARRLITLVELVEALLWSQDEYELAECLWVDVATVQARLDNLSDDEKDYVTQRLWEREESA